MIKIAVDAMGGDYAPGEMVKGAVEALKKKDQVSVVLVGQKDKIEKELEGQIRKRRERAEKTRDAVRETRQWLGSLNDIGSLISGTKGEIQRSLICSLFEKIWVYERKRVEFSFLCQDRMTEVYSLCGMLKETLKEQPLCEKGAV